MTKRPKLDDVIIAIILLSIVVILWIGLEPVEEALWSGNTTDEITATEITTTATSSPTPIPTTEPLSTPTMVPTATPTVEITVAPTATPTSVPTPTPTAVPTATPTVVPTATPEPKTLYVHQIAVGCANAYLIQCGDISIVIDGGLDNTSTRNKITEYLEMAGAYPLTAYVATHYHDDHTGNMNLILSKFANGKTIVYGPGEKVKSTHNPLVQGYYQQMANGDVIRLGDIVITCVGPQTVRANGTINQDSLNFVLQYGKHRFFFTGDYVRSKEVLAEHNELIANVDVFQFPHHGLEDFCITKQGFKTVNPKIVLVPANSSGPSRRLAKELGINAQFYDNRDGNIVIKSDGTNLSVHTNAQPGQFISD